MDRKKCRNLCAVRGCSVSYANLPEGVKLVGFPRDERLPKWVEAVKGEGSDWLPSKHTMICTLHFDRKYFKPDYLTRREWLLPGAIPSPAPQLPPACTIVQKLLPNFIAYVYRKKEGATPQGTILEDLTPTQQLQQQSNVERDTPVATNNHVSVLKNISDTPNSDAFLASRTPVSGKRGVSVLRNIVNTIHNTPHKKICTASSDSALCPNESPSANTMLIPLTPPVTPHHPASKVCESSAMSSSTPSAVHSGASLDGPNCSVSPCLSTPSRKRSAFPADISETPSKAVVLSGAPVTINLDIEEDDSPRKIILKQMIMDLEKKLENERKEEMHEKKQIEYYKRRYDEISLARRRGGAAATILKGRGALQDIAQISLFKSICKTCSTVKCVRDIAPTLRKAICEAQSGTPGPVFVEFPIDVLYPFAMVNKEVLVASKPQSLQAKAVHWYLNNYVQNIFSGAWEKRKVSPLTPSIPLPSSEEVQRIVELLSRAKRPLILIGSQATLPPVPSEQLKQAIESLGIPCYLGGMARGLLGSNSKLQFRHQRGNALKRADVVILAGSVCDFSLQYGRSIPCSAKIICVNRNKEQLWKNSDVYWKPTVPVLGDAATFMVKLSEALRGSLKVDQGWISELAERENIKEKANEEMSLQPTDNHINPMRLFFELEKILPDNAILVADGGDFVATGAYILRPRGALQWLDPGAFGTLGVGGGFALGAKLCRPDSEVWIIWGDGSCGYSVAEIDLMKRFGAHVISIVGNSTQILREQMPTFNSSVACKLEHTNYHEVSQGYGGEGLLLKYDKDDIAGTLRRAQTIGQKSSVLLNVWIGKTSFRDGSISV